MTKSKQKARKSLPKGDDEAIKYSTAKTDMEVANRVTQETSNQVVMEETVETVSVKETKTQIATVSKEVTTEVKSEERKPTENGAASPRKFSAWDSILFKRNISLEWTNPEQPEEDSTNNIIETSETVTKNVMEHVLFEYFYQKITSIIMLSIQVTYKVFRRRIGFGFISENKKYFKSKAVRVDKSSFFNHEKQTFVEHLLGYHPYSEVYKIWQTSDTTEQGRTFLIFRHFLRWDDLTEDQKESVKVATDVAGEVVFVDPMFVDEEYVVIELTDTSITWFWVVSKFGNLPVRMGSMFHRSSLTCSMSLTGLSLFQKLLLGSFSLEFLY